MVAGLAARHADAMTSDPNTSPDTSAPTLLLVALLALLVAVAAVVALAMISAGWAVAAGIAVVLAGLVVVARLMTAQLGDDEHEALH
jgi:hypothetical protein